MLLTNEQYNTLAHILKKTKMDCWFSIRQSNCRGKDYNYCYDLENRKILTLKNALDQAIEGFIDLLQLGILQDEIDIINQIAEELHCARRICDANL